MEKTPPKSLIDSDIFSEIFKGSSQGILVAEKATEKILYANKAICSMLGYSETELLSLMLMDIHPESHAGAVRMMIESLLKGRYRTARHFPLKMKDRNLFYADIDSSYIKHNGSEYIVGFFSDETESFKKELRVKDMLRDIEAIFSNIPYPVMITDADNNIINYNQQMKNLTGMGKKTIKGLKCWEVFHGRECSKPPFGCPYRHMLESGSVETTEIYLEGPGGYYLVSCTPVCSESGKVERVIHVAADITERKKLELELKELIAVHKETADTLEAVFDAIPDILGIQDTQQNIIRYNKAGYEFLKAKPRDVKGKKCWELIERDKPCEECATREALKTKKPAKIIKYLENQGIWIDARSYPVFDDKGNIIRILEHIRDITDSIGK